jgi:hypothetical protein
MPKPPETLTPASPSPRPSATRGSFDCALTRFVQGDEQEKKRIPFGNDKQKSSGKQVGLVAKKKADSGESAF